MNKIFLGIFVIIIIIFFINNTDKNIEAANLKLIKTKFSRSIGRSEHTNKSHREVTLNLFA